MKENLLKILKLFTLSVISFCAGFIILSSIFYVRTIKEEIVVVQDMVLELYEAQAAIYASQSYVIIGLEENLETAKAEAIKNRDELAQTILGVETTVNNKISVTDEASKNRDTAILSAVAKELHRPEYNELKSHTVMIIAEEKANPEHGSLGTGVVIKTTESYTYIVTNKHVCEGDDATRCYVFDPETKAEYAVSIVKRHSQHDVQIVKVSGTIPDKTPVKGIKDVSHQQKVYLVGHYLGNSFFYAEGVVAGFARENGDLVVAAPAGPGNSGSGIITQDGYLTGILYAGNVVGSFPFMTLDLTHSLCVNSKVLRLFLVGYIE
jgi:S1-C subfamily serine protease